MPSPSPEPNRSYMCRECLDVFVGKDMYTATKCKSCRKAWQDEYQERKRRRDGRRPRNHLERERFAKAGLICELFFGRGMQIEEIKREAKCSHDTISRAISRYLGRL